MHPFRIFLSYNHRDAAIVRRVEASILTAGMVPMWDQNIEAGMPLTQSIRELIDHAHLFMPLITKNSKSSPWVHEEIGYAVARDIPVLPVCHEVRPSHMISELTPLEVEENDFSDLGNKLKHAHVSTIVLRSSSRSRDLIEIAHWHEERTDRLAHYTNKVTDILVPTLTGTDDNAGSSDGKVGVARFDPARQLRQRGAFSSFCLPDEDIHHDVWEQREAGRARTPYSRILGLKERLALERQARMHGCSLALDLSLKFGRREPSWKRARLKVLHAFLEDVPDEMVRVVRSKRARSTNLTIVGDWYSAESLSPGKSGYRETVFQWHSPTVYRQIEEFDRDFLQMSSEGWGTEKSPSLARKEIEKLLESPECVNGTEPDDREE